MPNEKGDEHCHIVWGCGMKSEDDPSPGNTESSHVVPLCIGSVFVITGDGRFSVRGRRLQPGYCE